MNVPYGVGALPLSEVFESFESFESFEFDGALEAPSDGAADFVPPSDDSDVLPPATEDGASDPPSRLVEDSLLASDFFADPLSRLSVL
jgi:hypothetical protein